MLDKVQYQTLQKLMANNVGHDKYIMLTLFTVWMAKLMSPAAKAVANEVFNI